MAQSSQLASQGSDARRITPRLSVCIATFMRAPYLRQTLDSVFLDLPTNVEVLLVDGASPDDTASVVAEFRADHPELKYFREPINSGVDADYDRAVRYASGDYCWLMTDDDLLRPGAVTRVLAAIAGGPDLVVVNAEVRDAKLETVLDERLMKFGEDRHYGPGDADAFMAEVGSFISFVGGVVIRRAGWLDRSDGTYFGTLFAHVGVICQAPFLLPAHVIAEPLVVIRYGNAMWTARGFEIWMFKWPQLIWSFQGVADRAKATVTARDPWRSFKRLVLFRGTGGYSDAEYGTFLHTRASAAWRPVCRAIAMMPAKLANFVGATYCAYINPKARVTMYDLSRSIHSTSASRWMARGLLK